MSAQSQRLVSFGLLLASLSAAHAASFPCSAAHTPQEKAICADPALSTTDEHLAAAYKQLRANLSPSAAADVQSDQREWLLWLAKVCAATSPYEGGIGSCLTSEYNTRLRQLTEGHLAVNGLVFYPRAHFATSPEPPDTDRPPMDPGFSVFTFSWPQIDNPGDQIAAWNRAILNRVQRPSADSKAAPSDTFSTSSDLDGQQDLFYHLRAANQRLIAVDLGNMTYSYGAAHPNTGIDTFSWWLTEKRELTLADVFNSATDWQAQLSPIIQAKLKASLGDPGFLSSPADTLKIITEASGHVASWNFSNAGPTITFGQYAVASYADGMPSAAFTWTELKPFLNPALNPSTLPPPIPQPQP